MEWIIQPKGRDLDLTSLFSHILFVIRLGYGFDMSLMHNGIYTRLEAEVWSTLSSFDVDTGTVVLHELPT
jgi:hypothetical protein